MTANVELRGITKRFHNAVANERVDFDLRPGEIHALLGENGAGKTTLMNVLYGLYQPDEGTIAIDGRPATIRSPADAIRLGLGMVHQHFMLVPPLTVVENVILGTASARDIFPDIAGASDRIRRISERYVLAVNPDDRISELSVGAEQRVEILKALYRDVRILILDEPTAVLTPLETTELFRVFRSLAAAGCSIIFITHKLNEVMELADRVTVMRQGARVVTVDTSDTTPEKLAEMMVGSAFAPSEEAGPVVARGASPVLEIEDLRVAGERGTERVRGLSLTVHGGEIVGIAGVEGNGQSELGQALSGVAPARRGRIAVAGRDMTGSGPRDFVEAGVAYISEDRHRFGLIMDFSVGENGVLNRLGGGEFRYGPFLRRKRIARLADRLVETYRIRIASRQAPARTLSGGNQQKLLFAREAARDPVLYVACQPTRGLDLAAQEQVRNILLDERNRGKAVVWMSSDMDELLALSDRIAVMYEGRISGVVERGDPGGRAKIAQMMVGIRADSASPQ